MKFLIDCNFKLYVKDGIGRFTKNLIDILEGNKLILLYQEYDRIFTKGSFGKALYFLHNQFVLPFILFITKPNYLIAVNTNLPLIKIAKVRYIAMVHDLVTFDCGFTQKKEWHYYYKLNFLIVRYSADILIYNSTFTMNRWQNILGARNQTHFVVGLGIDHFNKLSGYYKNEYFENCDFILSVGTIEPRKNYKTLINGFLEFKNRIKQDLNLVIIGKYGWNSEDVISIAKNHKDSILIKNEVSDQELKYLFTKTKLFAFSSLYEGFGFPVFEAYISGASVISTRLPSIVEILGDRISYFHGFTSEDVYCGFLNIFQNNDFKKYKSDDLKKLLNSNSWNNVGNRFLNAIKCS